MLTKTKIALAALTVLGSVSMAAAEYDGDGNQIPGTQQNVVVRRRRRRSKAASPRSGRP